MFADLLSDEEADPPLPLLAPSVCVLLTSLLPETALPSSTIPTPLVCVDWGELAFESGADGDRAWPKAPGSEPRPSLLASVGDFDGSAEAPPPPLPPPPPPAENAIATAAATVVAVIVAVDCAVTEIAPPADSDPPLTFADKTSGFCEIWVSLATVPFQPIRLSATAAPKATASAAPSPAATEAAKAATVAWIEPA